jgi:hypothetical protein
MTKRCEDRMKWILLICCLGLSGALPSAAEAPQAQPAAETPAEQPQPEKADSKPAPIELRALTKKNFSGIRTPMHLVITNQEAWEEVWALHASAQKPVPPAPQVDFSKEVVLLASLGQKNTGGYSIEITEVRPKRKKLEIIVHEIFPGDEVMTIQTLTAPIHMVACPIPSEEIPSFTWTIKKNRKQAGLSGKRKVE